MRLGINEIEARVEQSWDDAEQMLESSEKSYRFRVSQSSTTT